MDGYQNSTNNGNGVISKHRIANCDELNSGNALEALFSLVLNFCLFTDLEQFSLNNDNTPQESQGSVDCAVNCFKNIFLCSERFQWSFQVYKRNCSK